MAKFPHLPLFVDAWAADTAHLSRTERGLYMDLLILMWRSPDCVVENDLAALGRKLRADKAELKALERIIAEFCTVQPDCIFQRRLVKEWGFVGDRVAKRKAAADARWAAQNAGSHLTVVGGE